jgi:hypothetical protein
MAKATKPNMALRALLEEAELSHGSLSRAVIRVGAEQGVHVATNPDHGPAVGEWSQATVAGAQAGGGRADAAVAA